MDERKAHTESEADDMCPVNDTMQDTTQVAVQQTSSEIYEEDVEEEDDMLDPEDDPNRDFMDDIVIGMPRMCFYGVLFGFGGGIVIAGLVGMLFHIDIKTATPFGIAGGAIGYLISKKLDKRRLALREQQKQQNSQS